MSRVVALMVSLSVILIGVTGWAQFPPVAEAKNQDQQDAGEESHEEDDQGKDKTAAHPLSSYARKTNGFHGTCGASVLVPPFRAGLDCMLGVRLGSNFMILTEGGFFGDENLYSVLFALGGRIHGSVFDSDTVAAHGTFALGEISSNGFGDRVVRPGLEWDAFLVKLGFGVTFTLSKQSNIDVSGAALVPIVVSRGNIAGLGDIDVERSVAPVQGQVTIGINFDVPGH